MKTEKLIRLTRHAQEQAAERGATASEIKEAVRKGARQPAKLGREMCHYNFAFDRNWQGKYYAVKQVVPIIIEKANEVVVITVYTFYF